MVAVGIAAVSQGLLLAAAGGANPAQIPEALAGGHGDSRILQEHGQRMINRTFIPGAPMRNFIKDIDTVLETARDLGVELPVLENAAQFYRELYQEGMTEWDHSAFLIALERRSKGHKVGSGPDKHKPEEA